MELAAYLSVAFLSLFFSLKRKLIDSSTLFFSVWLLVYFILVLLVRSEFDFDINTYAKTMPSSSFSLYYIREPVVWFGQRYLFRLMQDAFLVFVAFDMLVGFILYKSLRKFDVPQYAYFSILIFFPFVLGMQNVYRQWVSSVFFLYSFSFVWGGTGKVRSYVAFALAVLSHNVAALFMPLLFVTRRKVLGKLLWFCSFLVSFVGIIFGSDSKSSAETGANLTMVYILLLLFFVFLLPLLDRGFIRKIRGLNYKVLIGVSVVAIFSSLVLSSSAAERVAMFCLMISYPVLINLFEERFNGKAPVRMLFSTLGFIPMLLFGVSVFII